MYGTEENVAMGDDISEDEYIARRLQEEFDQEYGHSKQTEEEDRKLALSLAAHHRLSDSDDSETDIRGPHTSNVNDCNISGSKTVYLSEITGNDSDKTISEDELEGLLTCRKSLKASQMNNSEKIKAGPSDPLRQSGQVALHVSQAKPVKTNISHSEQMRTDFDNRPICKYGRDCYRKNEEHLQNYKHPQKTNNSDSSAPEISPLKKQKVRHDNQTGLYLTKVSGIPTQYNEHIALDIKDILSVNMGQLKASAQFNYMFEFPWLMEQYPPEFRTKPLLLVHGEQREAKKILTKQASAYPNITLYQAPLEILYGTHHTKMMFLLYESGLRVVIHTSNLIRQDWHQKTQGIWLSPILPKLEGAPSVLKGDSETYFKRDMLEYLGAYKACELLEWSNHIKGHDFSSVRVYLIGSVPGRHTGEQRMMFGHLKLRKILKDAGPISDSVTPAWPIIGQFSSIGSLGANPNQWLTGEFLSSLSAVKKSPASVKANCLKLIYPTVDNVRISLEGYPAGGSLPYSNKVAQKQTWLRNFLHQWKSRIHGRSSASPHIKTYVRVSPDFTKVAWMLITSANLSKAAWGAFEKNETQLAIRSYELGVLFLPQQFGKSEFLLSKSDSLMVPFDVPPVAYATDDQPWIWDIPHKEAPDRHLNIWEPKR